jgi:hypothetical protein
VVRGASNRASNSERASNAKKSENTLLHVRQLIPALSIRNTHGRVVHAWDFKAKRNLVIAFLDVGCAPCASLIQVLVNHIADLREKEAVTLLVFPSKPEPWLCDGLPDGMIAGSYAGTHNIEDFLGEGALLMQGFRQRAIFVTDRYGEISGLWITE